MTKRTFHRYRGPRRSSSTSTSVHPSDSRSVRPRWCRCGDHGGWSTRRGGRTCRSLTATVAYDEGLQADGRGSSSTRRRRCPRGRLARPRSTRGSPAAGRAGADEALRPRPRAPLARLLTSGGCDSVISSRVRRPPAAFAPPPSTRSSTRPRGRPARGLFATAIPLRTRRTSSSHASMRRRRRRQTLAHTWRSWRRWRGDRSRRSGTPGRSSFRPTTPISRAR